MSGLRWPLYFSLVFLSCYRSFELSHAAPHPGFGGVDVVFLGRCFVGVTTTYSLDNFSRNSHVVQVPVLVHMIGDTFWKTGSLGNAEESSPLQSSFAPWKRRAAFLCSNSQALACVKLGGLVALGKAVTWKIQSSDSAGSPDNGNNRRDDRLPFQRPACGHTRPSDQRN